MIPALLDPSTRSPGEHEIYHRLQDDPATREWIVLHSLDIQHHVTSVAGELDFLILVPGKGALALEVKACRSLRREGGLWYYGSEPKGDPRGPFKQASQAMHSVRGLLERRPDLRRVPFWSAVLFPYIRFEDESDEWHTWQVIDTFAFHSHALSALVTNVLDRGRAFLAAHGGGWFDQASGEPTVRQCDAIAQLLRPDFEITRKPSDLRLEREQELAVFTEEQFEALDSMAVNDRVAFEGAAGTGKTFLAMEAARRAALEGGRVLFLCFNNMLGDWLQRTNAHLAPAVTTRTLHSYMLAQLGTFPPSSGRKSSYWETVLPNQALEAMLDKAEFSPFDVLVVDEAQDILRNEYVDVLDFALAGGLAAGVWRFFGDFERQALYGSANLSLEEFCASRGGHPARFHLGSNCRNTPRIVQLIKTLARLESGYTKILRPDTGVEPRLKFYASPEDASDLLAATLKDLYDEGFRGQDIVVLSPRAAGSAAERIEAPPWPHRLAPAREAGAGQIPYATIHAFKGLEAAAVVLTDIEAVDGPEMQSLFYVGITRATDRLSVLIDEAVRPSLSRLLARVPERESEPVG
jgi:hypothetical protein